MALLSRSRRRPGRRAGPAWPAAAWLSVAWLAAAPSAPAQAVEYDVKAAYLFNFTKFVEWPPAAFEDADQPLSLCLVGGDPFGGTLDALVRGELVGGRRLVVRHLERDDDLRPCHVLFVGRSEAGRAERILAPLRAGTVLTVGESDGFLEAGGLLRFVLVGGKVRFEINRQAIAASPLSVSSKLQRLAVNADEDVREDM